METIKDSITSINSMIQTKSSSTPLSSKRSSNSSRRLRIPDRPKSPSLSLWGILKNCMGKDLSQVSLPINFNEPLSLLQRLTEEFEYAELLDKAANCTCPYEQLAYLAVFIVSGYSGSNRTSKPFNPLLGETFEFDRMADLGWKLIAEQISHHPSTSAYHCEGNGWIFWQEFSFETKFAGNDILVTPSGEANVEFKQGNSFKWNKILTTVHNFLIGSNWVDHQGVVEIKGLNKAEGLICNLEFIPYTGSSLKRIKSEIRKIKGEVFNADGVAKWKISGNCDDHVEIAAIFDHDSEDVSVLGEPKIVWKCNVAPDGSENYYSTFACQLNELEEGVAPTDSRNRPDQRLMEEGKFEQANEEKMKLEEKQRRGIRERSDVENGEMMKYKPVWFEPISREDGSIIHKFNGNYWKCKENQDWSKCPDIF